MSAARRRALARHRALSPLIAPSAFPCRSGRSRAPDEKLTMCHAVADMLRTRGHSHTPDRCPLSRFRHPQPSSRSPVTVTTPLWHSIRATPLRCARCKAPKPNRRLPAHLVSPMVFLLLGNYESKNWVRWRSETYFHVGRWLPDRGTTECESEGRGNSRWSRSAPTASWLGTQAGTAGTAVRQ
jgi:hypothetical protein